MNFKIDRSDDGIDPKYAVFMLFKVFFQYVFRAVVYELLSFENKIRRITKAKNKAETSLLEQAFDRVEEDIVT